MTTMIMAMDMDGAIGTASINSLPWECPDDMAFFKRTTINNTVVMGYRTFTSIGQPLLNRKNVVITKDSATAEKLKAEFGTDVTIIGSINEVQPSHDTFIIGGLSTYQAALDAGLVDRALINVLAFHSNGDLIFDVNGVSLIANSKITLRGSTWKTMLYNTIPDSTVFSGSSQHKVNIFQLELKRC